MQKLLDFQIPAHERLKHLSQFITLKQVGEGAFSKVFACQDLLTQQIYAIKIVDFSVLRELEIQNIRMELEIHSRLKNNSIVKYYGYFIEDEKVCILTEYLSRGSLFRHLSRRSPNDYEIRKIFRQVAMGIKYLHYHNILFRDLKPENVLLDDNQNIKLCDFGWACYNDESNYARLSAGTLTYMSPECLRKEVQTTSSDIWSLGIFLYELYHGKEPFLGTDKDELLNLIMMRKIDFKSSIPEDDAQFILSMLQIEPEKRPTIDQILSHNFFELLMKLGYEEEKQTFFIEKALNVHQVRKSITQEVKMIEDKKIDVFVQNQKKIDFALENSPDKKKALESCQKVSFLQNIVVNEENEVKTKVAKDRVVYARTFESNKFTLFDNIYKKESNPLNFDQTTEKNEITLNSSIIRKTVDMRHQPSSEQKAPEKARSISIKRFTLELNLLKMEDLNEKVSIIPGKKENSEKMSITSQNSTTGYQIRELEKLPSNINDFKTMSYNTKESFKERINFGIPNTNGSASSKLIESIRKLEAKDKGLLKPSNVQINIYSSNFPQKSETKNIYTKINEISSIKQSSLIKGKEKENIVLPLGLSPKTDGYKSFLARKINRSKQENERFH